MTLAEAARKELLTGYLGRVLTQLKKNEDHAIKLKRLHLRQLLDDYLREPAVVALGVDRNEAEAALEPALDYLRRLIISLQQKALEKARDDVTSYLSSRGGLEPRSAVHEYFFDNQLRGQERRFLGVHIAEDLPDAYFSRLMVAGITPALVKILKAKLKDEGFVNSLTTTKKPLAGNSFQELFELNVLPHALSIIAPSEERSVTGSKYEGRTPAETAEKIKEEVKRSGWLGWKGKYAFIWWKCSKEEAERLIKDHRFPELRGDLHVNYKETPDKDYVELIVGREGKTGGDESGRYLGWMGLTKPGPLMGPPGYRDVPHFDIGPNEVVLLGAAYLQPFDLWALRWNGLDGRKFDWTTLYWKWDVRSAKGEANEPEEGEVHGRVVDVEKADAEGFLFPCENEGEAQDVYEHAGIGKNTSAPTLTYLIDGEPKGASLKGKIDSDGRFVFEHVKLRQPFIITAGKGKNTVPHTRGWPRTETLELTPEQLVLRPVIIPLTKGGKGGDAPIEGATIIVTPSEKAHERGIPLSKPFGRKSPLAIGTARRLDSGFLLTRTFQGAINGKLLLFFARQTNGFELFTPQLEHTVRLSARKCKGNSQVSLSYNFGQPRFQNAKTTLMVTTLWFGGDGTGEHLPLPKEQFPPGTYRLYCAYAEPERSPDATALFERMLSESTGDALAGEGLYDYNHLEFTIEGDEFVLHSISPETIPYAGAADVTLSLENKERITDIAFSPAGEPAESPHALIIGRDKNGKLAWKGDTLTVKAFTDEGRAAPGKYDLYVKAASWHLIKKAALSVSKPETTIERVTPPHGHLIPDGNQQQLTITGTALHHLLRPGGHNLLLSTPDNKDSLIIKRSTLTKDGRLLIMIRTDKTVAGKPLPPGTYTVSSTDVNITAQGTFTVLPRPELKRVHLKPEGEPVIPADGQQRTLILEGQHLDLFPDKLQLSVRKHKRTTPTLNPEFHVVSPQQLEITLAVGSDEKRFLGKYDLVPEDKEGNKDRRIKPLKKAFTVTAAPPQAPDSPPGRKTPPDTATPPGQQPPEALPEKPGDKAVFTSMPKEIRVGEQLVLKGKHLTLIPKNGFRLFWKQVLKGPEASNELRLLFDEFLISSAGGEDTLTTRGLELNRSSDGKDLVGGYCIVEYLPNKDSAYERLPAIKIIPSASRSEDVPGPIRALRPATQPQESGGLVATPLDANRKALKLKLQKVSLVKDDERSVELPVELTNKGKLSIETDGQPRPFPPGSYTLEYTLDGNKYELPNAFTLTPGKPVVDKFKVSKPETSSIHFFTGTGKQYEVTLSGSRLTLITKVQLRNKDSGHKFDTKIESVSKQELKLKVDSNSIPPGKYEILYWVEVDKRESPEVFVFGEDDEGEFNYDDFLLRVEPIAKSRVTEEGVTKKVIPVKLHPQDYGRGQYLLVHPVLVDSPEPGGMVLPQKIAVPRLVGDKSYKLLGGSGKNQVWVLECNSKQLHLQAEIIFGKDYKFENRPLFLRLYVQVLAALPTQDSLSERIDINHFKAGPVVEIPPLSHAPQENSAELKEEKPKELGELGADFKYFQEQLKKIGENETLRWHKKEEDEHYEHVRKVLTKVANPLRALARSNPELREDFKEVLRILKAAKDYRKGKKKENAAILSRTKKREFYKRLVRLGQALETKNT